jgi:hypothetical protein
MPDGSAEMIGNFDVPCPECGSNVRVSLDTIAAQRTVYSSRALSGTATFILQLDAVAAPTAERKFEQSLKKLQQTARRLGR